MKNRHLSYTLAGWALYVSAALHATACLVSGFSPFSLALIPVALLYAGLGYGLIREVRWLAYVVSITLAIGANIAFMLIGRTAVPDAWTFAMIAADVVALVMLFIALWQSKPTPAAS